MSSSDGPANRLATARSPYLLLHQHNPVDWYEWGEEAIARARAEDKPIFLSVGYSTCYWCHVMERESFSSEAIAARMNADFVNVKLDREERPELDEIYMTATQILTGRGGWPNSVFLTPELEPFFAGTYFPPEDRPGMPGFPTVLRSMAEAWRSRRDDVEAQAESVGQALRRHLDLELDPEAEDESRAPGGELAERSLAELERSFDPVHGGFGGAPKFPTPSNLLLLLEFADESESAARMLEVTLDRMARGGIYDQLGGGFHRYATDREWLIPHFEKMLYDNGLLLEVYARQWSRTGDPQAERVMRQTAGFLAREMTSPEGAFWSALDAETDGHEGAFYVWTREELLSLLGEEDYGFAAPLLGFQGGPFFEGSYYVLHLPDRLERQAERRKMPLAALERELEGPRRRLFETRSERPPILTDDKVLADWNGMAIAGLAAAGGALGDPGLVDQARAAAAFVLAELRTPTGTLLHAWREGHGEIEAFLGDYAFLTHGLVELERATGETRWGDAAVDLVEEQIERLSDPRGGFFSTVGRDDVLVRSKDLFDGAVPAANAIAVLNLLDLAPRRPEWTDLAARSLAAAAGALERAPSAARMLALGARRLAAGVGTGSAEMPSAEERESPVVVSLEAGLAGDGGERTLRLHLSIAEGWHVYAAYENGDAPDWVTPTAIAARGFEIDEVRYPPARELAELLGRDRVLIWEGEVTVELRGRDLDANRREIEVRFQPCDESRCLAATSVAVAF